MTRDGTRTSDFGVSKRESHDSSRFYNSRLYDGFMVDETPAVIDNSASFPGEMLGKVMEARELIRVPDNAVHLVILELPRLAARNAEAIDSFLPRVEGLAKEIHRVLITGGRAAVIVDNVTVEGGNYYPVHSLVAGIGLDSGLYMRGEVILKAKEARREAPAVIPRQSLDALKCVYRHGLVFSKTTPKRIKKKKAKNGGFEKTDTVTRDQFLAYTKSVWEIDEGLVQAVPPGLPASDVDYYQRFIHLYSFLEDTVVGIVPGAKEALGSILRHSRERWACFSV